MNELRIKQVNELEQFIDNAIFIGDEPCDIAEMVKVVTDKQNKNITKELEETKAKLHSLQVEILDMSCAKENNSGFEPSLSVYQRSIDMVIAESRKTPAQSLSDIMAEAVMDFMKDSGIEDSKLSGVKFKLGNIYKLAQDHANRIKEG